MERAFLRIEEYTLYTIYRFTCSKIFLSLAQKQMLVFFSRELLLSSTFHYLHSPLPCFRTLFLFCRPGRLARIPAGGARAGRASDNQVCGRPREEHGEPISEPSCQNILQQWRDDYEKHRQAAEGDASARAVTLLVLHPCFGNNLLGTGVGSFFRSKGVSVSSPGRRRILPSSVTSITDPSKCVRYVFFL